MPTKEMKASETFCIEGKEFSRYSFKKYNEETGAYEPLPRLTLGSLLLESVPPVALFDKKNDTLVGFVGTVWVEEKTGVLKLEVKKVEQ
jgi:hypothetical protein